MILQLAGEDVRILNVLRMNNVSKRLKYELIKKISLVNLR